MPISSEIKNLSLSLGAEKCGIASVDRFKKAPDGFHPKDIYNGCKSVIVFLIQMPTEIILASNPVAYSHTAHLIYSRLDKIGLEFCKAIQSNGNHAGNMVYIGAILTDNDLDPDPVIENTGCPPKCSICLDGCPQKALDGLTVNQKLCREFSAPRNDRGFDIYACNLCRRVCIFRTRIKLN